MTNNSSANSDMLKGDLLGDFVELLSLLQNEFTLGRDWDERIDAILKRAKRYGK